MVRTMSATEFLPDRLSLRGLREAAARCRGCDLYEKANRTVFGEGKKSSRMMLVGETPGDVEDRQGHVFVGPAGHELDRALGHLGIDRRDVYLTNAVKHFRFEERGKRRIHQTPTARQVTACRPWLEAELRVVKPEALVVMGAVAAKSLLGNAFRVTERRGQLLDSDLAPIVVATIHPSAVLRAPDDRARIRQREAFTKDLQVAAEALRAR
jgi:uracil-DNA glycosylase family protein